MEPGVELRAFDLLLGEPVGQTPEVPLPVDRVQHEGGDEAQERDAQRPLRERVASRASGLPHATNTSTTARLPRIVNVTAHSCHRARLDLVVSGSFDHRGGGRFRAGAGRARFVGYIGGLGLRMKPLACGLSGWRRWVPFGGYGSPQRATQAISGLPIPEASDETKPESWRRRDDDQGDLPWLWRGGADPRRYRAPRSALTHRPPTTSSAARCATPTSRSLPTTALSSC